MKFLLLFVIIKQGIFELKNRAIILSNGKIIASGSPKEVISDRAAKTQYFGDEFNIN